MVIASRRRLAFCALTVIICGCAEPPDESVSALLNTIGVPAGEFVTQTTPSPEGENTASPEGLPAPADEQLFMLNVQQRGMIGGGDAYRGATPAFPGAEGFGAMSKGGRGDGSVTPRVIAVTTLADRVFVPSTGQWRAAPGSLREAVEASGPRFVVFRVAGTIFLDSDLRITNPYITIAGQTAPGQGIAIAHHGLGLCTSDIVLRHLRVRILFEDLTDWANSGSMEGVSIFNSQNGAASPATNIIIDHCSISWAIDQNFTVWHWAKDFTIQWSIISEAALYGMFAGVGTYGTLASIDPGAPVPDNLTRGTMHHNLMAHNKSRNAALYTGSDWDYRNNFVYNWNMIGACDFKGAKNINFVGNVYFPGLDTGVLPLLRRAIRTVAPNPSAQTVPHLYIYDNLSALRLTKSQPQWDVGVVHVTSGAVCGSQSVCEILLTPAQQAQVALSAPAVMPPVSTDESAGLLSRLIPNVGATRPTRDAVDTALIGEVDYVNRNYTPASIIPPTDTNVRRCGPHHGPVVSVLFFDPINDPGYTCGPRQYRMAPGETLEMAKYNMLTSRICTFPDGLRLPEDVDQILADPVTYPFHVEQMVIPNRATVRSLYPEITTPVTLPDNDGDGIPNSMETIIGTNPGVSDAFGDADGDGYLNFEEYLNWLAP